MGKQKEKGKNTGAALGAQVSASGWSGKKHAGSKEREPDVAGGPEAFLITVQIIKLLSDIPNEGDWVGTGGRLLQAYPVDCLLQASPVDRCSFNQAQVTLPYRPSQHQGHWFLGVLALPSVRNARKAPKWRELIDLQVVDGEATFHL